METMTALLRIAGDMRMTVQVKNVTPAEAFLLMHIHDPATKDVFEDATMTDPVDRTQVDERSRLRNQYPEQAKLIDQLFPGRNASDVPDAFTELNDVPLTLSREAKQSKAREIDEAVVKQAKPTGRFAGMPSKRKGGAAELM